jgi:hypothetical protein
MSRSLSNHGHLPSTPPSTPYPEDTSVFFGWYSEAAQQLMVSNPSHHKINGKVIMRPPYCYWLQGDKKVLITEVTHSSIPTPRQVANGDVCVGQVDKYIGRTYSRL